MCPEAQAIINVTPKQLNKGKAKAVVGLDPRPHREVSAIHILLKVRSASHSFLGRAIIAFIVNSSRI